MSYKLLRRLSTLSSGVALGSALVAFVFMSIGETSTSWAFFAVFFVALLLRQYFTTRADIRYWRDISGDGS